MTNDALRTKLPFNLRSSVLGVLLLSFALRVHRLGDRAVWWDEGWSVWVARHDLLGILWETGHDVHPPLYFWLLHLWRGISGDSEFGLRLLSALAGVLAVAVVYRLGRAMADAYVGGLAALFLAVSRFHIVWSQEIRMYALAALLAGLGMWAAVRIWERGRGSDYLLYVLAMSGGLLTLYLFFPVPVAANVAWLWVLRQSERRRQILWRWAAAQAAVLLIIGAWLAYALQGFLTTSSATPVAVVDFLKIYWTALTIGVPLNVEAFAPYTLAALAVFLAGLAALVWRARRRRRVGRDLTALLTGLLIPVAVVYYISIPKEGAYAPPFAPRYLVVFSLFYVVLLAWGIRRLGAARRWPLALLLSGVMLAVAGVGLDGYYRGRVRVDDYASLAATLRAYERPSQDAVILYTDTDWPIFAYHHPQPWRGMPHTWDLTAEAAAAYLTPIWEAHEGVWLATTPYAAVSDPAGRVPAWLAARATAVSHYSYGDKALTFYARTEARAATRQTPAPGVAPPHPVRVPIAAGTRLVGYEHAVRDYESGAVIPLFLYWRGANPAQTEVGVMDGNGRAWAWQTITPTLQADAGLSRQQVDLRLAPDAPSGEYAFYLFAATDTAMAFGRFRVRQESAPKLGLGDVTIPHRLDVDFGDNVRLLGYGIETEAPHPGGTVHLALYWQARGTVAGRYKVFTHLLGDAFNAETGNFLWGQQDNEPVNLTRPTTSWRTGEVIVDRYAIPIAGHAPPGAYQIEVGMYDPATGERLPVLDEGGTAVSDHLILSEIEVFPE
jgi:4-amino-4-deoxy-L-arabinose transferase-like glycosyltransferase